MLVLAEKLMSTVKSSAISNIIVVMQHFDKLLMYDH